MMLTCKGELESVVAQLFAMAFAELARGYFCNPQTGKGYWVRRQEGG